MKGEDHAVTEQAAQEEHAGPEEKGPSDAAAFVVEQRGLHEAPHLEDQVGKHQHQRKPERRADVRQELRGDIDVDDVHMVVVVAEVGKEGSEASQARQPPVERKVGTGRCLADWSNR